MKLSSDQIEGLFIFVRKHFVEHYDLQTELVDHLANGIEAQWQEHPERSYKDARLREFRKFGVCGFADVISKRSLVMEKRYWKQILRFYREYFKLPKILFLIGSILMVFQLIRLIPVGYKLYSFIGLLMVVAILMIARAVKNRKKYRAKIGLEKRWMLEEKIFESENAIQFMYLPIQILLCFASKEDSINNLYVELALATTIVCYLALCYVMVYVIPQKAQELLAETYLEYKIV